MPKLNLDDPDGLYRFLYVIASRFGPREALYGKQIGVSEPAPRRPRKARNTERPAERGSVAQAAAILGLGNRKVQVMSQRGEIPGAAKMGRQWTYDLAKLRRFVAQQERTCASGKPRPDATGGEIPFGAKLKFVDTASDGRLVRMIQRSRKRVAKLAKNER